MILSGKLMLEHLGEDEAAASLEDAVAAGHRRGQERHVRHEADRDDPTAVGTSEYADAIIEVLRGR